MDKINQNLLIALFSIILAILEFSYFLTGKIGDTFLIILLIILAVSIDFVVSPKSRIDVNNKSELFSHPLKFIAFTIIPVAVFFSFYGSLFYLIMFSLPVIACGFVFFITMLIRRMIIKRQGLKA